MAVTTMPGTLGAINHFRHTTPDTEYQSLQKYPTPILAHLQLLGIHKKLTPTELR